jgi:hypothetical protein
LTDGTEESGGSLAWRGDPESAGMTGGLSPRLRRSLAGAALAILAIIAVEQIELTPSYPMTRTLMQTQDVPVLVPLCALMLALAAVPLPAAWGQWAKNLASWQPYNVVVPIVVAVLVVAFGTRYVASYTPVSHDEIMGAFDAAIIASGRILAPIAPEWRSLSWALEPVFRLPVAGDVAWVSTYLPGNAAIRGVLGKVFDAATGRMFDNGGTPPDVALSFRSLKSNGSYRYYQFLKGKFGAPSEEQASSTDTPDPKPAKITYTAVKTIYQFDLGSFNDGVKRVIGDEDTTSFSATTWFSAVQVPSAGAPGAFSLSSSSPADAATGVVVSVNITLTFSNALASGSENGILLTTAAGVPKACDRTLNAGRTVVTLDPTTNMAGATEYLVIIPGVVDVFGQALADTVINFTTA